MGKELAYSGGGYFRFFPLWFVKRELSHSDYAMCYFHIGDLLPGTSKVMSRADYEDYFKEPGTLLNRYKRHLKSNIGKNNAWPKLKKAIDSFGYVSIEQAVTMIDWQQAPLVALTGK